MDTGLRTHRHSTDVPVFAGLAQRVLRLGDASTQSAYPGECPIARANSGTTCRSGWRRRKSAHLGRLARCRRAVWPPPGGPPDAPGGLAGRAAAATLAQQALRDPARRHAQSSRAGFHAESFFGVLKRERVNRQQYQTRAEARADSFDDIARCHNPRQRRRLAFRQEGDKLLTQPSVISG
jgi:hypothetical protein